MDEKNQNDLKMLKKEISLSPALIGIGAALTMGALIYESAFVFNSKKIMSTVVAVESHNAVDCTSRKGSGFFSEPKLCTQFNVDLSYKIDGQIFNASIKAGSERGHDVSSSHALYQKGQPLEIRYSAYEPKTVVVNKFNLLFLWTLVFGTTTMFMLAHYMYKRNQIREVDNKL